MKVIPLYNDKKTEAWIRQIQAQDALAQKELYLHFSPKMLGVCRRYIRDLQYAEDCMVKGFVKVFKNCHSYKNQGSFEGWIRRIMVNECLTYLRLQKSFSFIEEEKLEDEVLEEIEFSFDAQTLMDRLPEGYRVVFNLFVMEGFSHKEIAEELNISESTSKSQLFKAKKQLRAAFTQQETLQQ